MSQLVAMIATLGRGRPISRATDRVATENAKPVLNSKSTFELAAIAEMPVLYRVARRMTRDPDAAEDLVGQTLLKAANGWAGFDGRYPRSWMIRIMHNVYLKDVARQTNRPEQILLEEATFTTGDVWHDLDVRLLSSSIVAELDRIPDEYRLAVTLCDMEELSYEEAAEAMSVPIGTVRSRLYRGRQMLRERLASLTDQGASQSGDK